MHISHPKRAFTASISHPRTIQKNMQITYESTRHTKNWLTVLNKPVWIYIYIYTCIFFLYCLSLRPRRFCPLSSQQEYPGELEDTHLEGRRLRLEPEADHSEPRMFWMDWHGWRGTAPSDPGSGDLVVSGARSFVGRSLRQKCGPVVPGMHFWRDGHAMATLRRRLRAWATHVHLSDAGDSLEPVLAGSPISAALQSSLPQVE